MAELNYSDIQGFVFSSYATKMPCANYILVRITEAAPCRSWLNKISGKITTGKDRKEDFCLNIAFTATAFKKLDFTASELQTFSVPFQEGMDTSVRQQILGDDDRNAPENWIWGNQENPVDVLLLVFARDEDELKDQLKNITSEIDLSGGVEIIQMLAAGRQPDSHEHFGFLDGVGQPVIEGTGQQEKQLNRTGHATVIKAGEFILGYENEMGKTDAVPEKTGLPTFGENGTYLVFRQIEQHVATFWNYLKETTVNTSGQSNVEDQEKLAAKMVGRWKSGAPITSYPDADPAAPGMTNEENDFSYSKDDNSGFGCPYGAHIRRSNPRDSLFGDPKLSEITVRRHRILRRGRSYGDRAKDVYINDGKERGLHFICLNSNIERQFEFTQQTWVNNESFATLNQETDPLIGHRSETNLFTMQGHPCRTRIHNLPDFVTTKGGAYFFMPGIFALHELLK